MGRKRARSRVPGCGAVLAALLVPAMATGGGGEINQVVVEKGLPPCDSVPGFPCTITESGAYELSGNLTLPDTATTGISIQADDVSLDLNGFTIFGSNECSWDDTGGETVCTVTGGGRGISSLSRSRARVSNGRVVGTGGSGLDMGPESVVMGVDVSEAGGDGISVGANSRVEGCTVALCSSVAIDAASSSSVRFCTAVHCLHGVRCTAGCTVADCALRFNEGVGIRVEERSLVRSNTVYANGANGIILWGAGATAVENAAVGNGSYGMFCSGSVAYGRNVFQGNGSGTLSCGAGHQIAPNLCDTDTSCP